MSEEVPLISIREAMRMRKKAFPACMRIPKRAAAEASEAVPVKQLVVLREGSSWVGE